MSDNYQAVYDAVRSRFHSCDVGQIVRDAAVSAFDMGRAQSVIQDEAYRVAAEMSRPSVLFRPTIVPDGNKWSAFYGPNLMEGVCGFGDTPDAAMRDFDKNWDEQRCGVST